MTSPESSILNYLDDDVLGVICEHLQFKLISPVDTSSGRRTCPKLVEGVQKSPLDSLSRTCKRLRVHSLPYVFNQFTLHCYGNSPWDLAMLKLQDWNPDYSSYVQEIHLRIELGYKEDPEAFAEELPDTLAKVLSKIATSSSRLHKFSCIINEDRAHLFHDAFTRHNLTFSTVKQLIVGPYNEYAVKLCPNTDYVSVNDWVWGQSKKAGSSQEHSFNLIKETGTLPYLKVFIIMEWLSEKLLQALHDAVPHIQTLVIPTSIGMDFEKFIMHLSRFRHIEILSIPSVSQLGLGFTPPICGNAYRGPNGGKVRKRVAEEAQAVRERAATEIFDKCPWLKELWFEGYVKVTQKDYDALGKRKRDLDYNSDNSCPSWL
ncbi:hypothetical protein D9758_006428 [Tetrapyrgos nigripes]|uniref:Uncharacterized protein n=1 Tax=Tetrapyrgos nigripes TaxID=182062 RepID=A0A8H5D8M7_9AGAR|nr:hypothetical protein D9758_006428 [Tetrapyrgos nigripes]